MNIDGSKAVVTGASGGIGRAIARALHREGATVVLTGRREAELRALSSELGDARVVVCDLADPDDVTRLVAELGDVDIVVANAALPAAGRIDDFTVEEIDRALAVNLRAPMVLARELVPGMLVRGRGHFVFISSIGGKLPTPQLAVYAATKFGLRGFSGSLRQDLAGSGVSSSVVFPGSIIDAGMLVDAGLTAPKGTRGSSSGDVAAAVVEVIRDDRGEVDAAELMVRFAAKAVALFPNLADKMGSQPQTVAYAGQLTDRLRHLR
jgi:short-subunit dehydrogenase